MYITTLPFDYISHLDPGDRVRTKRRRTAGGRVRRAGNRSA